VSTLQQLFERSSGPVETIGLGDASNDAPFLNVVTVPVIVRSRGSTKLKAAVPQGILTDQLGPAGWNETLLKMIPQRIGVCG
jgi:predicted mannosyl-3-phosphoglycerate phosphatase (HAD superfamily)